MGIKSRIVVPALLVGACGTSTKKMASEDPAPEPGPVSGPAGGEPSCDGLERLSPAEDDDTLLQHAMSAARTYRSKLETMDAPGEARLFERCLSSRSQEGEGS